LFFVVYTELFADHCVLIRATISSVTTSLFDLYKIGVGPSSSHTMGPMRAACRFARGLGSAGVLERVDRVQAELYGSLALTGLGHATDRAVLLGLAGNEPAIIDPAAIESTVAGIRAARRIDLAALHSIGFDEARDLLFKRDVMFPPGARTQHPNGLRLTAYDAEGRVLNQRTFFSIGGGFITEDGVKQSNETKQVPIPFPFHSSAELLATAHANELSISQLMLENECARAAPDAERAPVEVVRNGIDRLWEVMQGCVQRGIAAEGILPGGLNVRRRVHRLAQRLHEKEAAGMRGDPLAPLDWVAMAGGRASAGVHRRAVRISAAIRQPKSPKPYSAGVYLGVCRTGSILCL
jgi:L-serine dehydratase